MHTKQSWRQARPPKSAKTEDDTADPDLQAGAAILAGNAGTVSLRDIAVLCTFNADSCYFVLAQGLCL